ncbi:iron chelate uptake ABC transporter family permease subunit [soil metagenome]
MTIAVVGLSIVLVVLASAAVSIGSVRLSVTDVWSVVGSHLGLSIESPGGSTDTIVWVVRVPRVALAAVVGCGLAVVGAALQAAVRNPIADPYLLGMSSGASVGAVAVIAFGVGSGLGVWALSGAAFLGALAAALLVVVLAARRAVTPLRIILTGTAVAYGASAVASFLIYRSPNAEAVRSVLFWLLGSLSGASWAKLAPATLAVTVGLGVLWLHGRHLDALLAGDDTAAALGVDVARFRRRIVVLTSVVTAAVVAVSGAIGFVGLLLPHAGRFLVGNSHRALLPVTGLLGAIFLVFVDLVARTAASPEEIPVGIITAGLGAPFFLWVLHRRSADPAAVR